MVLEFFFDQTLQRIVLKAKIGKHSFEFVVLGLELFDPLQIRCGQAAVLRLPLVVGRRGNAVLAADVLNRDTGVGLIQNRNDLGLCESGLLQRNLLARLCQKALLLSCPSFG